MFETKTYRASDVVGRLWWGWCYRHRALIAVNFFFLVLFSSVNGLYAPIVKEMVDGFRAGGGAPTALLLLALAAALVKAGALLAHKMINNRLFSRIVTDLQSDVFGHMVDSDLAWHALEPAAARAARVVGDVGAVRMMLERVTNNFIRDGLMVVAVFASMIYIDWELSLIALMVFPIAIWPIAKISRTLRKIGAQIQIAAQALAADLHESMASIRVVKAYRLERAFKSRLREQFERQRGLGLRAGDLSAAIDPILEVLGGVAVVAVLVFVGWRIEAGQNTLGDFAGFVTALLLAAQPMRAFGNLAASLQHGLAAGQRVLSVLDERSTVVDAPGASALPRATSNGAAAIRFEAVSFSYDGVSKALDGLDLTVAAGERLALVGRSGAGKSTVFNLVPRLYDPTEGRVLIDGRDLRDVSIASLRARIALVTQEAVLFNDSVAANIAAGVGDDARTPSRAEIVEAAKAAAAHDFIAALPKGYDTVIGDRGDRLSGGQRQRLSIARAFLREASILLLDEPTSALDSESERQVKEALDRLSVGRTTIVIAHRLSTILDSDRIAVLEAGRLVELGDHAALLRRDGVYAGLYRLQFASRAAE